MYRQHIETPLSIPGDLKVDMDFMAGSDRGRIYRILTKDYIPEKNQQPHPEAMEKVELVPLLAHPNRWWRLQTQQLRLEQQNRPPAIGRAHICHPAPKATL